MEVLLKENIPVASSCSGQGVCVKCIVTVIEGSENLSPQTTEERDLAEVHDLDRKTRISCQAQVTGDITLDTDYW